MKPLNYNKLLKEFQAREEVIGLLGLFASYLEWYWKHEKLRAHFMPRDLAKIGDDLNHFTMMVFCDHVREDKVIEAQAIGQALRQAWDTWFDATKLIFKQEVFKGKKS